jgi:hypothetical protein
MARRWSVDHELGVLYVAGGLGLRECAKGEGFSGNVEIRNHLIDEL